MKKDGYDGFIYTFIVFCLSIAMVLLIPAACAIKVDKSNNSLTVFYETEPITETAAVSVTGYITAETNTASLITAEPQTAVPVTTGKPQTAAPVITEKPQKAAPVTTEKPQTTAPVTTAKPQTAAPVTTEKPQTTVPVTTVKSQTTAPVKKDPINAKFIVPNEKDIFSGASVNEIKVPVAAGSSVGSNDLCSVDYSNAAEGYVMVKYTGNSSAKKIVRIITPGNENYDYILTDSKYNCYSLSSGVGIYKLTVYEQIDGNKYMPLYTVDIQADIKNDYCTFLYPNHYVNYNSDSKAVKLAKYITSNDSSDLLKIEKIYTYVTDNIKYDNEIAAKALSGYTPDLNRIMVEKTGICFDYASLMTAMLRSLYIPTKIEVGYAGDIYHAWISVYTEDTGWVKNIIYFNGSVWKLMDPTYASTGNHSKDVMNFIENTKNYLTVYQY